MDEIEDLEKRKRLEDILNHIKEKFPQLKGEIKWKQPMFMDHGTFIIAFTYSKSHILIAPEEKVISVFEKEIKEAGYTCTKNLFRIKWDDPVNFDLIDKIVEYNIDDKKGMTRFWR